MKKTILTLVGTAALFSVLTTYTGAQERVVSPGAHITERERKGRKGYFNEVNQEDRGALVEQMAKELSPVIELPEKQVQGLLAEGKTPKEIILLSGKNEELALQKLEEVHKEKMKEKVRDAVRKGTLTQEKADEIERKLNTR